MKGRISKVTGLLEKTGLPELQMVWPENLAEFSQILGKKKLGKAEIDLTEEKICTYAWRGFTLSFQTPGEGQILTEEEKQVRKVARKTDNSEIAELRKLAKEQGVSLAELIKSLR